MVKVGITYRVVFSILGAAGLAILILFLIMLWSLNRGFYEYLGSIDQSRMESDLRDVAQQYEKHGSWDFLRMMPPPGRPEPPLLPRIEGRFEPGRNQGERPPLPPFDPGHLEKPLVILDADRKPVLGMAPPDEEIEYRPIIVHNNTVGYAGLISPRHFLNPMQLRYLREQKLAFGLAALAAVSAVLLIALPLASRLVKPLRAMATATHDISSGNFRTRVPVSSSDELGRLARDFNDMALTLEKHEQERRQWVADISHELRTPVAILRGETEALLDKVREITPDRIRSLHAETLRLNRLVDDLYQLALSDAGALSYRKANIDCIELLRESMDSLRQEFEEKKIVLTDRVSESFSAVVFADWQRLGQLFTNVLENSLRYTDAGGTTVVSAASDNGRVIIEVSDTKPGVPDRDLPRLFERLFRTEGSRSRSTGGAGLGLAICRKIAEAHSGGITAHQSPLGGLLVRIELPLSEEPRG